MRGIKKGQGGKMDFLLLLSILVLTLFGFVMLLSANAPLAVGGAAKMFRNQSLILIVGIAFMAAGALFDYHIYARYATVAMVAIIIVMAIVPLIGIVSHGATRQIPIGSFSIQPSEFAKFALVVFYATVLSNPRTEDITTNKRNIWMVLLVLALLCGTCLMQSHLSAMLVICFIGAVMLITAGLSKKAIKICAVILAALSPLAIIFASYRLDRIKAYFSPFENMGDIGWQIVQSYYAVGSGGLFGLGLGQSRQKYEYLPEAQNDYIYAIVCEELGFIGGVAVILLFTLFVWRGMSIALKAKDKMGMYLAFGISCIVGIQMLINIAVVLSLIPSTGMQLPLFSSGGSSMVATMWGMGVLLNISKTSRIKKI